MVSGGARNPVPLGRVGPLDRRSDRPSARDLREGLGVLDSVQAALDQRYRWCRPPHRASDCRSAFRPGCTSGPRGLGRAFSGARCVPSSWLKAGMSDHIDSGPAGSGTAQGPYASLTPHPFRRPPGEPSGAPGGRPGRSSRLPRWRA